MTAAAPLAYGGATPQPSFSMKTRKDASIAMQQGYAPQACGGKGLRRAVNPVALPQEQKRGRDEPDHPSARDLPAALPSQRGRPDRLSRARPRPDGVARQARLSRGLDRRAP